MGIEPVLRKKYYSEVASETKGLKRNKFFFSLFTEKPKIWILNFWQLIHTFRKHPTGQTKLVSGPDGQPSGLAVSSGLALGMGGFDL